MHQSKALTTQFQPASSVQVKAHSSTRANQIAAYFFSSYFNIQTGQHLLKSSTIQQILDQCQSQRNHQGLANRFKYRQYRYQSWDHYLLDTSLMTSIFLWKFSFYGFSTSLVLPRSSSPCPYVQTVQRSHSAQCSGTLSIRISSLLCCAVLVSCNSSLKAWGSIFLMQVGKQRDLSVAFG